MFSIDCFSVDDVDFPENINGKEMTFVFPSKNGTEEPKERSGHVAVHFDGYIVVWGGYYRVSTLQFTQQTSLGFRFHGRCVSTSPFDLGQNIGRKFIRMNRVLVISYQCATTGSASLVGRDPCKIAPPPMPPPPPPPVEAF